MILQHTSKILSYEAKFSNTNAILKFPNNCSYNPSSPNMWRMICENNIAPLHKGLVRSMSIKHLNMSVSYSPLWWSNFLIILSPMTNGKQKKTLDLWKSPMMNQTNENLLSLQISQGRFVDQTHEQDQKEKAKTNQWKSGQYKNMETSKLVL